MRNLGDVFDDRITRAAGIVFILILSLVLFNIYSSLPTDYPLFGVIISSMIPVLFVTGGIIFVVAILRS